MVFKVLPEGVHWSKRVFDFTVALLALLLLSPVFLVISLAVLVFDGRPVFFCQERPGIRGEVFTMCKFRTMAPPKRRGRQFPPEKRISKLGAFLRTTSLDELPELFNVLKGEMSLIGPRPLLVKYLKHYTPELRRRHDVLPGITGWAQINGRNILNWEERFAHDVWYVDNWSFALDLKIILRTIKIVLTHEGVSPTDGVIMEEFKGIEVNGNGKSDSQQFAKQQSIEPETIQAEPENTGSPELELSRV
ncbi:MAG: sugar transferase [Anaerolineae bacterium]|nr:sugar transferase [Anaerolineae bacterium]